MNEHLRDRILRKLETLSDERGYQVLDYVEFLESRYAERASPTANTFTPTRTGMTRKRTRTPPTIHRSDGSTGSLVDSVCINWRGR